MSLLDQPDRWISVDPQFMSSLLEAFPDQVRAAAEISCNLPLTLPQKPANLVVTGLGGSAIGGDIARSVVGRELKVPLIINRDYRLPGFVDFSSLVFACSYSGNTEETISSYLEARQAKAARICITSGGRLKDLADCDDCPVISLPGGLPPRAALGYSLLALLGALQALYLTPDMTDPIAEVVDLMPRLLKRYGPANPETDNIAKRLARSLHGRIIAIYASNEVLDAAAFRWRSQIAENAKSLAFHHLLPEMNHNELVGWQNPRDLLREIGVVLLRDKGDHPQVQRRFELTRELIRAKARALVHEVWSEGDSLLARIMSIIYLGDFVSLYLAYLNETDPTPVEVIDYMKRKLGSAV